jgi:phosphoribosyl-AMP cyclohydrolase
MKIEQLDFEKGGGLIPVVAQDATSGEILMLAYANREAVEKTLQTGYAHYYSRSRRRLWLKGEDSGNKQKVLKILVDCDLDALIYLVEQKGAACHTGNRSCFYRELTK